MVLNRNFWRLISNTQNSTFEPNRLSVENNLRYFVLFLHKSNHVNPYLFSVTKIKEFNVLVQQRITFELRRNDFVVLIDFPSTTSTLRRMRYSTQKGVGEGWGNVLLLTG